MTRVRSRGSVLVLFLLGTISTVTAGDLKVVSVARFENGNTFTNTHYTQGERVRIEWRDQSTWKPGLVTYGPPRSTIYQCDAQRVLELNLKSHQYAEAELNDECRVKNAPPLPAPKGRIDVYIESTDTGERRQILGQTARHIITHQRQVAGPGACWEDGEMEWDGWYIDKQEQPIGRQLHPQSGDQSANVIMTGVGCRDRIEVHRRGVQKPGFPVKLVQTSRTSRLQADGTSKEFTQRWEIEVTELSDAPLDAALFVLPAGFNKVAKIDAGPDMPFSVAVDYWWHRTLRAVRSLF